MDGTRVLVLHPPRGAFGWSVGRVFEHMLPEVRLERELGAEEAAGWLARVAPAREDDLMGVNP
ncbi:hypothetical protein [Catenulispora subtropica]|uniref:Uncharacterized protein n=1 Tax=Catenulispora subtropica TaxID=450798 RepID=A0ABN2RWP9_9ACTN